MLARHALPAADADEAWLKAKPALLRHYAAHVLAAAPGLAAAVTAGAEDLETISAEALSA